MSLAQLKDHGLAGITGGMKNYFGAIHNPNKYHDSRCDPYVAEVFDCASVKRKHRLTVLDALKVQYHRGPSFHARWADSFGALIFSTDPVAADVIGWRLIEKLNVDGRIPVNAITTVSQQNIHELDLFVPLLRNTGITWQVQFAHNVTDRFESSVMVTPAQYAQVCRFLGELILRHHETIQVAPMDGKIVNQVSSSRWRMKLPSPSSSLK